MELRLDPEIPVTRVVNGHNVFNKGYHHGLRGKTYEEYYGKERAVEIRKRYNPQNHLAADNKTTCLIFPLKQKTKRLKKRSKQHTKSVIQMLFKSHLNNTFYI